VDAYDFPVDTEERARLKIYAAPAHDHAAQITRAPGKA
jgi:hypothetical protein